MVKKQSDPVPKRRVTLTANMLHRDLVITPFSVPKEESRADCASHRTCAQRRC